MCLLSLPIEVSRDKGKADVPSLCRTCSQTPHATRVAGVRHGRRRQGQPVCRTDPNPGREAKGQSTETETSRLIREWVGAGGSRVLGSESQKNPDQSLTGRRLLPRVLLLCRHEGAFLLRSPHSEPRTILNWKSDTLCLLLVCRLS